jgi:hypothetical protein
MEHGARPKAIQAILGHSTLEMTMRIYTKATDLSKREAVSVIPFAEASPPGHVVPIRAQDLAQVSEIRTKPLENKG